MEYSARDIAKTLLADGVQPGTRVADARDYDRALSRPDPEGRLAATVIRAAERELGVVIGSPDAKLLDYRQVNYLVARLNPEHSARAYEQTPSPVVTISHLMNSVLYAMAHARRHLAAALASNGSTRTFNLEHVQKHLEEAAGSADHLQVVLRRTYPEIGAEFDRLTKAAQLDTKS